MAEKLRPIKPEEIAFVEADGAISINAAAVANRLNGLLERIERLERPRAHCDCMNCIVMGGIA